MFHDTLGDWLELQRRRADFWKKIFFAALILLLLMNVFVRPKPYDQPVHPAGHVEEETHLEDQPHGPAILEREGTTDGHGEAHPQTDDHSDAGAHGTPDHAHGTVDDAHGAHGGKHGEKGFFKVDAPHFVLDKWPGFWAVFSLVVAVGMILVLKKIVAKVIGRKEDFYAD